MASGSAGEKPSGEPSGGDPGGRSSDGGEATGYTVAYGREDTGFPVYLTGFLAAVLIAGWTATGSRTMLAIGAACLAFAYYNFPLTETGRPRLGANQYGIFIEGFGLVRWRAIRAIELVTIAIRADTLHQIRIELSQPLASALIADWRQMPWWRRGMRLIWIMGPDNAVRIKADALERTPDEVHRTLARMWRFYRS